MSSKSKKKVKVGTEKINAEVDLETALKALKIGDGDCAILPSKNLQENLTTVARVGSTTTITIIRTERHNILGKRRTVRVIEVTGGKVKIDRGKL